MVLNGLNFSIVLSKCVISGANTAVRENGAQSAERLVCAVVLINEIRDKGAKVTAKIVMCRGINKALIYKLCGKRRLEINC